jgi:hypothetical protein
MRKLLTVTVAVGLLYSGYALAQQEPSMGILVEKHDEDALNCDITDSRAESAAALALRNNGLKVVARIPDRPYLYLWTTVFRTANGGCMYSVYASVRERVRVPSDSVLLPRSLQDVVFCESSTLGGVPARDGGQQFSQTVARTINACLADLKRQPR